MIISQRLQNIWHMIHLFILNLQFKHPHCAFNIFKENSRTVTYDFFFLSDPIKKKKKVISGNIHMYVDVRCTFLKGVEFKFDLVDISRLKIS